MSNTDTFFFEVVGIVGKPSLFRTDVFLHNHISELLKKMFKKYVMPVATKSDKIMGKSVGKCPI